MLTIGTGIGGGLVLGGELYRGSTGAGAELGHVVVDADGPPCQGNCPNHGCVETLASGTALAREGRAAAEGRPDSALGRLRRRGRGDRRARRDRGGAGAATRSRARSSSGAGRSLGVALASLANVFEPDVIVLGGGVMAAGELLLAPGARRAPGAGAAAAEPDARSSPPSSAPTPA